MLKRATLLLLMCMGSGQAIPKEYDIDATLWGYCVYSPAGCYTNTDPVPPAVDVYLAEYDNKKRTRDFFWFPINVLSGQVLSVSLRLQTGIATGNTLNYSVRNYGGTWSYSGVWGTTIYGSRLYSDAGDDNIIRDITLGQDAIDVLNALGPTGGTFKVAGSLSQVSSTTTRSIFAGTIATDIKRLIIVVDEPNQVPEPGTLFLLGSALTALGVFVRRHKRAA